MALDARLRRAERRENSEGLAVDAADLQALDDETPAPVAVDVVETEVEARGHARDRRCDADEEWMQGPLARAVEDQQNHGNDDHELQA